MSASAPFLFLEAERQGDVHQTLTAGVGRRAFVGGAGRDLAERRRIGEVHAVFGAERLYHLNGFWKSKRKVAVARSLILHSFDAENWQSMKRCRSKVLRPTLPRPIRVGIGEVVHRLDQAVLRGLEKRFAADVLPVVAQVGALAGGIRAVAGAGGDHAGHVLERAAGDSRRSGRRRSGCGTGTPYRSRRTRRSSQPPRFIHLRPLPKGSS